MKKNLSNSNTSSTCPHNMVNFGPLAAQIDQVVWAPQQISTGFASWQRYCTASSSGRQPNFATLSRGCHLCSAGRPSRWSLAHISSFTVLQNRAANYAFIGNVIVTVAYGMRQAIIFLPCGFFLLLSFFIPSLISAVADWMFTILPHMVWP